MTPHVSILIDTYNHEKYLAAAIRSVMSQQGLEDIRCEIVVVDDGSTDRTKEIVDSFGDQIRYYFKPNGGQASAFNTGIPLCRGNIICFLDGDDWWHPDKLRIVLSSFDEDPDICALGHSFLEVDELTGASYRNGPDKSVSIDYSSSQAIAVFQYFACCFGTSRLAIRRSTAMQLLDVPEALVFEADEYLFTLLPTMGKVVILPQVLTYYRIHGGNLFQDSRSVGLKIRADAKLLKRASIYDCLSRSLPIALSQKGCENSAIITLMRPINIQASRLKLMTIGGTPLENFKSEWKAAELFERGLAGKAVLYVSLALALVCPPKVYFGLRQMYANARRRVHRPWRSVQG